MLLEKGIVEKADHAEYEKHLKLDILRMSIYGYVAAYFFSNDILLSFFIHTKEHEA